MVFVIISISIVLMVYFPTKGLEIMRGFLYLAILLIGGRLMVAGHYSPDVYIADNDGIKRHYFPFP